MRPELVLMRVPHQRRPPYPNLGPCCPSPLHSDSHRSFTGVAQWDQNHAFHLGAIAVGGILNTYTLESQEGGASYTLSPASAYQLHLLYGGDSSPVKELTVRGYNSMKLKTKAVDVQLGSFEFIPGRPDEILFFQLNSSRILFARLPTDCKKTGESDPESSKVFCIGRHSASIVCISVRSDGLVMLSTASDGSIRVWGLADGSILCETNVSYANPAIYYLGSLNGESKGKCDMCGETLQSSWCYARVLLFIGQSWGLAMGCMDGLLRIWTKASENLDLKDSIEGLMLMSTETLFSSSKASISALAIHSQDGGGMMGSHLAGAKQRADNQTMPVFKGGISLSETHQQGSEGKEQNLNGNPDEDTPNGVESSSITMSSKEYMAAGTTEGGLMVWARYAGSHGWIPAWSRISAEVSITCLNFRADGGLLAAGASVLSIPSPEINFQGNSRRLVDSVHLYETSSWSCVGTLSFNSRLGSCAFYHPGFVPEGNQGFKKGVERELKLASGMLLVCTSDGPETHLIPEFVASSNEEPSKRNVPKTVRWADTGAETHQTGRLQVPMVSPRFPQHFGGQSGVSLTDEIGSLDLLEGNMSQVENVTGNDSDSSKISSELSRPREETPNVTSLKKGGKPRRCSEKSSSRKEVQKPGWDRSIAKIEVGKKVELHAKDDDRKEPNMIRLKGGRGQDATAGSKKKECKVNPLKAQSQEQTNTSDDKKRALQLTGESTREATCQVCSHPISDHYGPVSAADQECYYKLKNQTQGAETIQGDNEKSHEDSCCGHITTNPDVCQVSPSLDEEQTTRLQTNSCSGKDHNTSHPSLRVDHYQSDEDTFKASAHEKLDQPSKVLDDYELKDQKRSCVSLMLTEKVMEVCQTCLLPMRDQPQEARKRGIANEMNCHPHTSSTIEGQDKSVGFVDVVKDHLQETCPNRSTYQLQMIQMRHGTKRMSPVPAIVPGNFVQNLQVTEKLPVSPCLANGGNQQDPDKCKPCSQHRKDQVHMTTTYSSKENHTYHVQSKSSRHSAKSSRNCSVCSTPTKEQYSNQQDLHHDSNQQDLQRRHASPLSTPGREGRSDRGDYSSWNGRSDSELEKACQQLCEQIQLNSENNNHRSFDSSGDFTHMEFVHYQATLHAKYAKSRENECIYRKVKQVKEVMCPNCHHPMTDHKQYMPSTRHVSQPQSPRSDANTGRHQRECCAERPMSVPLSDRLQGITTPRDFPEEVLRRFRMGKRVWPPQVKKDICVGCKPGVQQPQPIHSEEVHPLLRAPRLKPKLVEQKKLRFCTGLHRGKGEVLPKPPSKKRHAVLPVVALSRDNTKGVWNRKANKKEWDCGHRGCCSQHWVSMLDPSKKVCHAEGCRGDELCGEKMSPSPSITPKVASTTKIMQKIQAVRAEKFHPKVAMSLIRGPQVESQSAGSSGLRGSLDDRNRPHSVGVSRHLDSPIATPRSVSSCGGVRVPVAVAPAPKLKRPELNSSAWLLAKVEELHKESFNQPKALQVAQEHGLVLDKEDEAELRKYLRAKKNYINTEVDPLLLEAEREARHTRDEYFDLSNIVVPHHPAATPRFAPRKVPKPVDSEAGSMRRKQPSISDLWVAAEQCPQVCSRRNLNLTRLDLEQEESEEARIWSERESACREALTTMNVYDSCR